MSTVARTILAQLGGNKFVVMTGAKDMMAGTASLQFRLPRGARDAINSVYVALMPDDTYTAQFWKLERNCSMKLVKQVEGVYAGDLRRVFTESTGLETSLGTMGAGG